MRRVFLTLLLIPMLLSALHLPENDQVKPYFKDTESVFGEAERGHGKQKAQNSRSESFKAEMNNNIGKKIANNNGEATSAMHTDDNGTERGTMIHMVGDSGRRVEGNPGMADSFRVNTQANRVPAAYLDDAISTTSTVGMSHGSERFTYEMQELTRQNRAINFQGCQAGCPLCNRHEGRNKGRVNVVRGRPTRSSPLTPYFLKASCIVANGYRETSNLACFVSGTSNNVAQGYWQVDMQEVYTFRTFVVSTRLNGDLVNDPVRLSYKRFSINGILCIDIGGNMDFARTLYVSNILRCNRVMRGQYIIIENSLQTRTNDDTFLVFCEVKLWICEGFSFWDQRKNVCRPCGAYCKTLCDNYFGCVKEVFYNVAIMKSTSGSKGKSSGTRNSVDGRSTYPQNTDHCFLVMNTGSYSRTYSQYIKIHLEGTFKIQTVIVRPRSDCCADRMKGMYILLFNETKGHSVNMNTYRSYRNEEICKKVGSSNRFHLRQESTFSCEKLTLATHVALQAIYPTQLEVCEVKVMGYAFKVFKIGQSGCRNTPSSGCEFGLECEDNICKSQIHGPCARSSQCLKPLGCDSARVCKKTLMKSCNINENECSAGLLCDSGICKLGLGSQCANSSSCAQDLMCDIQKVCRKGAGINCSTSDECVFGTACMESSSGIRKCNCSGGMSPSGHCAGGCDPADLNSCTHGSCSAVFRMCICEQGYILNAKLLCILRFGAVCTATDDCVQQMCENGNCRAYLRGACLNDSHCLNGALCDSQICRYQPGHACNTSDTGACISGTLCYSGVCKLKVGEDCSNFEAHCGKPLLCDIAVNGTTCRLPTGHLCLGSNKTMCMTSTVCDPDEICRIENGETCNPDTQSYCHLGSSCDNSKCTIEYSGSCAGNEQYCGTGYTCDALKQCRIKKNGDCKEYHLRCLAGGYCNSDFICECSEVNAQRDAEMCDPVPGVVGAPCPNGDKDCTEHNTRCDMQQTPRCTCHAGLTAARNNYTCHGSPGSHCNNSYFCSSGMICGVREICEILPGEYCIGFEPFCSHGTFCDDDGQCRFRFDTNCTLDPKSCALGYICDLNKLCRIAAGKKCSFDDECESGSTCVESACLCTKGSSTLTDGKCVPDKGILGGSCLDGDPKCILDIAICVSSLCACPVGYLRTSDLTCKKNYGMPCVEDDECVRRMICNNKVCRKSLGNPCNGLDEECVTGAVCDIDNECKLGMNSNCSNDADKCRKGTFCDWYSKCRLGVNGECKDFHFCPTGAICENGFCICEKNKAEKSGIICGPTIGRVGSFCNEVTKPCIAPGSQCIADTCDCPDGTKTHDFACDMVVVKEPEKKNPLLMLLPIIGALLLITLICCCLWFRKKKKEKAEELLQRRGETRAQIEALEKSMKPEENPEAPSPKKSEAPPPEEPEAPPSEEPEAPPSEEPEAPPPEEPEAPPPEEPETSEEHHEDDENEEEVKEKSHSTSGEHSGEHE